MQPDDEDAGFVFESLNFESDCDQMPKKFSRAIAKKNQAKPKKEFKAASSFKDLKIKPSENLKQFKSRVAVHSSMIMDGINQKEKGISQKRKSFLKRFKKKQIGSNDAQQQTEQELFARNKVAFGEVVSEPPKISVKPKEVFKNPSQNAFVATSADRSRAIQLYREQKMSKIHHK